MTTLLFSAALGPALLAAFLLVVRTVRALPTSRYLAALLVVLALDRSKKSRGPASLRLNKSEAELVKANLEHAVIRSKLFKNSTLKMSDVVTVTGLPPESLREAVRRSGASNFFDYVNRARNEAACEALATVDSPVGNILLEVGLNSPPSFYTEFRKRVGHSPTSYRRQERGIRARD